MDLKELRIRRLDAKNIVIERLVKPTKKERDTEEWEIWGYYGKLEDIALALLNLVTEISEPGDLAEQVTLLRQSVDKAQSSIIQYLESYQRASRHVSGQTREPVSTRNRERV